MHESQRYRYNAAECLRAAQQARDPFHRAVHLSMALSWLSLARQDETTVGPVLEGFERANFPKPISHASGHGRGASCECGTQLWPEAKMGAA
jgi:hypothetical protein